MEPENVSNTKQEVGSRRWQGAEGRGGGQREAAFKLPFKEVLVRNTEDGVFMV